MGKAFISITTILAILILIIRSFVNRQLISRLQKLFTLINHQYLQLFQEKSIIGRMMQTILLVIAQIFVAINIITFVINYVDTYLIRTFDILLKLFIILAALIVIYLAVGYILLTSSNIYKVFYKVEDQNIKLHLLLSYFILSIYFTVLLVFPHQFEEMYQIGIVGTALCYILNLKVLIKIIRNPQHVKSKGDSAVSFKTIAIVAILILIMIILNLFLGVCFINSSSPSAYTGSQTNFDLFYYTIITFTTIGYGDIVPLSISAKIMSIVISMTSVICLT
ncbi:MAG: potassium channel family protein, partial [Clostridium sp.]|nr:potassium channel family protein [Clostridium sp.]